MKHTHCGRNLALIALAALLPILERAQSKPKPPGEGEAINKLQNYNPAANVAELASEMGFDFSLTHQVDRRLRLPGVDAATLRTLRDLPPKSSRPAAPAPSAQDSLPGPAPGTVRENPKDGLKYVWVPPGVFVLGCSPGDNECADNEKPAHEVTLKKGFWEGQRGDGRGLQTLCAGNREIDAARAVPSGKAPEQRVE